MSKYNLIFDFDGVLADTLIPISKAYKEIFDSPKSIEEIQQEIFINYTKNSLTANIHAENDPKKIKEEKEWIQNINAKLTEIGFEMFATVFDEMKNIPEARFAIVSSSTEKMIRSNIINRGIKFDLILGCDTSLSKQEKVQMVLDKWEIPAEESYYITDTISDVIELRDMMGIDRIIGCSWGWHGFELLRTVLPIEQIMDEPFEIHRIIDNDDLVSEMKFNKNIEKNEKKIEARLEYQKKQEKKRIALEQRLAEEEKFTDYEDVDGEEFFEEDEELVDDSYEEVETDIELTKKYTLLDSTGIRRPGQRTFGAETFATERTIQAAYDADVICMVVDGSEPLSHQDQVVAGILREAKKGCVVIVNKADLVDKEEQVKFIREFEGKFAFLKVKKFLWVSAKTGYNKKEVWNTIDAALEERKMEIPREEIRKLFNYLMKQKPPKKLRIQKRPVIYDLIYTNERNPTFELLCKNKMAIHWSYLRFLENVIRRNFGFENTEIKVKAVNITKLKDGKVKK
jgi:phosphoglycolate phosphatase-like HAD superfamily hydrolase